MVVRVFALPRGVTFGLGSLWFAVLACSGSTTSREGGPPEPKPDQGGTLDSIVPSDGAAVVPTTGGTVGGPAATPNGRTIGGATTTTTGGSAGGAGAPTARPLRGPDRIVGDGPPGTQAGGGGAGGGGSANTGGAGGAELPNPGTAGDANPPDPPIDPDCRASISESWSHPIGAGSNWEVQFGDPSIDTANHRLVVSYDDVAAHTTAYEGGYYVTAKVSFDGGTVLTPYPYASNEVRLPSLRRSGNDIELGGTMYGSTQQWTNDDWPGFSGVILAATTTVTVTTYVQATAKALAVKVTSGSRSYRSSWVSGFTWPQTNLGIMRYTGEDNSRVYWGADAVYVGPLSGCQKLSDAAVEAAFEN